MKALHQQSNNSKSTRLSKVIFSIRSQTFDIKTWNQWKYDYNACVAYHLKEENTDYLMNCNAYENCMEGENCTASLATVLCFQCTDFRFKITDKNTQLNSLFTLCFLSLKVMA